MATSGENSGSRVPSALTIHQQSRQLEVQFEGQPPFLLSFELLRVYSPSAEVRGHGPGQEVLQTGKRLVEISEVEPVGNYGIRPRFSDGHDSGIFSWAYLYELGVNHDELSRAYEERLAEAGADRDTVMVAPAAASHCSH